MVLLNLGAGLASHSEVRVFKGEVAKVIGADIDPIVLENEELDEAAIIEEGVLPFPNNHFDIVLSDFVLEHVENPLHFMHEVYRVLKPGGSFFFRTPNKFHYVSIIGRYTPHLFHKLVANRVRCLSEDSHEPYQTFYRLNSKEDIEKAARNASFHHVEIRLWEAEPSYLKFSWFPFLVGVAYERLVNSTELLQMFRANIFGRLVKRSHVSDCD